MAVWRVDIIAQDVGWQFRCPARDVGWQLVRVCMLVGVALLPSPARPLRVLKLLHYVGGDSSLFGVTPLNEGGVRQTVYSISHFF